MPVQIVEESRLLRDMFISICREANVPVGRCSRNLVDLPILGPDDMILLHSNQNELQMVEDLAQFRQINPDAPVVLVTQLQPSSKAYEAISKNVHAVFPESKSVEALVAILQVVRAGYRAFTNSNPKALDDEAGAFFPAGPSADEQSLLQEAVEELPRPEQNTPSPMLSRTVAPNPVDLSERERTILQCLMYGASNKTIANDLGICEATVKVHLRTCFRKIGVRNRTQAAIWASEQLGPPPRPMDSQPA